ncbi:hypothetical protein MiTe_02435 [Microcystis aeruginosa NIES-2520]|jgi:hypothetical protein|uniref:PEP-CTERM protein-sorting domain-containing protein n=1 Tax=Microcystis aeruginosa NIES-2520 TaxID=2303982 RepID=A0A5A5RL76_MICAE|nr:PEP-CTERM sorting domain-containing protein [Microcystis aeruginosa]GCA75599.1 hypothetical protein MiTe_02435 [Microcystis aeruginosa NIES-2520]
MKTQKLTITSLSVLVTVIGATLIPEMAQAISYWDAVSDNAAIAIDTALGNLTAREGKELIGRNWAEWRRQREQQGKIAVGQVGKDGFFPVAEYTLADLGTIETLTYFFIDPVTGQKTQTQPDFEFSAVRYDALLQPFTLDKNQLNEASIRANLVTIGTSSDAASNFEIPFTLQGFEPIILGFPLDANGNEISGEGTAGFASNVLVSTPEPTSTLGFLALGTLGAASTLKRKLKPSKSSEKETTKIS